MRGSAPALPILILGTVDAPIIPADPSVPVSASDKSQLSAHALPALWPSTVATTTAREEHVVWGSFTFVNRRFR